MPKPKLTADRRVAKEKWSSFVRGLLEANDWSLSELAYKLGCSKASVSRWASTDPIRGTIPHSVAKKQLVELARKCGLVQ
jgi:ribosome-binding protein aMBF1 (putative translation factor)